MAAIVAWQQIVARCKKLWVQVGQACMRDNRDVHIVHHLALELVPRISFKKCLVSFPPIYIFIYLYVNVSFATSMESMTLTPKRLLDELFDRRTC